MSRAESQNWLRRTRRSNSSARSRKTGLTRPFEGANLERLEERVLMTFTPIAQPNAAYTSATTLIPITPPDGTVISSVSDGIETVSFSPTLTTATVPAGGWNNWNSPPNAETSTPRVVFNATATTETFTLSTPAATFGVEAEADTFGTDTISANFFNGVTLLGTISQSVTTPSGSMLFAGTSTGLPITSVTVSETGPATGIGFAQLRYAPPAPPLTGSTGNAITGVEGSSTGTVLLGPFVDADQAATAAEFTTPPGSVVVNWGDGSAHQILAASNLIPIGTPNGVVWTINAAHTYTEEGTYAYTVTVTDTDGAAAIVSGSATIADAALNAGTPTALTPNTGIALPSTTIVATFIDANTFATTADYTASIGWGDGSPATTGVVVATATPGVFDVEGGHTYANPGDFTTQVSVHDDGGSQVVVPGTSVVTDLPVTGSTKSFTTVEGQNTGPFVLATFADPNTLATVSDVQATLAVGGWGDGTPGAAGVQLVVQQTGVDPATGDPTFEILGSHTYAEETPPGLPDPLSVIVTTLGGATTTLTSPPGGGVTVLDASLTGSAGTAITGVEGKSTGTVLLGTFVDANQAATVADYTSGGGSVVVNWGDGSAPQTLPAGDLATIGTPEGVAWTINAAHTYAEEGTYAYTVTVTDDGGASTIVSGSAIIADAALTAGVTVSRNITTGVPLSAIQVGSFTDANPTAPLTDFTGTIDWGDGSPNSIAVFHQAGGVGTVFDVEGSHNYAKPGVYTVTTNVLDVGGSRITLTATFTTTDLPVTGSTKTFTTVEGQNTGLFVLATFADPNTLATVADVQATLAVGGWGDGTPGAAGVQLVVQQTGVAPATGDPTFEILGSHIYAEETAPGTPDPLSVIVTTLGGATTTLTSPPGGGVTVLDAELSSSNGTKITGVEGINTGNVLLGTFRDANQAATVADYTSGGGSVTVNWGDGTPAQTLAAANLTSQGTPNGVIWSISAAHAYAEEGTNAYSVTVTDDGGSVTEFTGSAVIADAPLTPVPATIQTTESPIYPVPVFGKPIFSGAVGGFTDANTAAPLSDFKAVIFWGDNTSSSAGTIIPTPGGPAGSFTVTGNHTYADAGVNGGIGTYTITVFVSDVGGSQATILSTADVADIPITVTGILSPGSDTGQSPFDAITDNDMPTFQGTSEPLSTVTLLAAQSDAAGTVIGPYVVIGQTTANASGDWKITSRRLPDGYWTIAATAIDQFGKTTTGNTFPAAPVTLLPSAVQGPLLIDTAGPKVTDVLFNRLNGEVDVVFQDGLSGMNLASLLDSNNYVLTKPNTLPAKFLVTNLDIVPLGVGPTAPVEVRVIFNSGAVLKGGFYTFEVRSASGGKFAVQDVAGNDLDGRFFGNFPSGDGVPGGDFIAMLDAFHDKVFAPQTVIGTADPANGGQGGAPVGAVHSGVFNITPRRGVINILGTTDDLAAAKITAKSLVPAGPRKKK